MGQRLIIQIRNHTNDTRPRASIYYHWSGYTLSALREVLVFYANYLQTDRELPVDLRLHEVLINSQAFSFDDLDPADQVRFGQNGQATIDQLINDHLAYQTLSNQVYQDIFGDQEGAKDKIYTGGLDGGYRADNPEFTYLVDQYNLSPIPPDNHIGLDRSLGLIAYTAEGQGQLLNWGEMVIDLALEDATINGYDLFVSPYDEEEVTDYLTVIGQDPTTIPTANLYRQTDGEMTVAEAVALCQQLFEQNHDVYRDEHTGELCVLIM